MRRTVVVIFVLFAFGSTFSFAGKDAALRYTVVLGGNKAGTQVSTKVGNEWHYSYEYNDRGRGPKIEARMLIGAGQIPVVIEDTGVNYLKSPVAEKFSIQNGKATWKNESEDGSKAVSGRAFYLSINGVPEEFAWLARALLAAPGHKLALLPDGEASIERVSEQKVQAKGQSRTVVQYSISGLGLTPSPIWLERDGTLFAIADSWSSTVLEGWEDSVPALLKAQDEVAAVRTAKMAQTLAHRPTGTLAFRGIRVFDSENASVLENQTVVVSGNHIESIGPSAEVKIPENAEVIDGAGKTLLPGLWDMHVHLGYTDGPLNLAAGVTTVRDLGNSIELLGKLRQDFDQGRAIGPRIVMAGIIDGPGPYQGPTNVLVDTETQAREAVDRYASLGYVQIKIYSSVKPELVPAIIDEARKKGLRVSGHVPAFMTAEQAVREGYDEIQHVNFLFLNFMFDKVQDTRTPARFTALAENAALLDLKSQPVQDFIHLLQEHKTVSDPTVNAFEDLLTGRPGKLIGGYEKVADRLPPQVRRGLVGGGLPVPEGMDQRYLDSFQSLLRMVKLLYDSGITIVAGTDSFPGFALHHELELYVQAGIPALKVLQIATLNGARVMKMDKDLGSITPGKLADLVVVTGDPLANISDIRNTDLVVKDGVVYHPADLYRSLGIKP
jgi:imidazolonepropionase-like amidohydrolase